MSCRTVSPKAKFRSSRIRFAFLSLLAIVSATPAQSLFELYQQGVAAAEAGDQQLYLDSMERALELAPAQPALQRHRAQALAALGRADEAMDCLRRLIDWGVAFAPAEREEFAALRTRADWPELLADYERSRPPIGHMELAFEIAVDDLIPEGIAYEPATDCFLISSIAGRNIHRVALDGSASPLFAPGAHGFLAGLGLAVDVARGRLWAVSDAPADSGLFSSEEIGRSAVHVFALPEGRLLWSHFSDAQAAHSYNDVVILPDGSAVLSAAGSGTLFHYAIDGGEPTAITESGAVPGANGLCLAADARSLYVSAYIAGVQRVDLATGDVTRAADGDAFSTAGVDGLYRVGERLIAVQNYSGLDRVALFDLDASGAIAGLRVAVARQPIFVDPTTGALREGRFYFLANSHVQPFFERTDKLVKSGFGRTQVHSIQL